MLVGKQAESAALAARPVCRDWGPHVLVPHIALNAGFLLALLKEGAGIVFLRLEDTRHIQQTCFITRLRCIIKRADGK